MNYTMKKKKFKEVFKDAMMPLFLKSLKWHHQDIHSELNRIKDELSEIKQLVSQRCV